MDTPSDRLLVIELSARYVTLMREVDLSVGLSEVLRAYGRLVARHREKARVFHTMYRVASCLREFDRSRVHIQRPIDVEMAIFYRHAVYDVRRVNNIEHSAKHFEFIAKNILGINDTDFIGRVSRLIRVTNHVGCELPSTNDEQYFHDICCAVLGTEPQVYDASTLALRKEYSYLSDAEWAMVRTANFIDVLLAEEEIYLTLPYVKRFGDIARANLMEERFRLQKNIPVI